MHEKRLELSWWKENREMIIINWGAWYFTFGTSCKKKWSKSLEYCLRKKWKSNIKLLHKLQFERAEILQDNTFLLLNFVFFSYRERVFSKHLTLVSAYVPITNNLKFTAAFLIMKSIIRKFQILINNNNSRLGILF